MLAVQCVMNPRGPLLMRFLLWCVLSLFFFPPAAPPRADVLGSIQAQLQMKRSNMGLGVEGLEGSKARRDGSQNEDLRGGKATCKGNMEGGKKYISHERNNEKQDEPKHGLERAHRVGRV